MSAAAPPRFSDIDRRAQAAAAGALPQGPAAACRAAIAEADAFLAEIATTLGLQRQLDGLACAKGCASCCHQMVGVTLPELEVLAAAVAALPPPRRAATIARIRDLAGRSRGLTVAQWWQARLPCPLLDDSGACVVHHARPLPCRAMNSADADICRRAFAGQADARHIPVLKAQHGTFGHAQAGLAKAAAAAGHPPGAVPLAAGLANALIRDQRVYAP